MADEDAIERAAVVIYPDLTGFRKKLQADLKKAVADVNATVKIRLVADKTGFAASVRDQLKLVNAPTFKVKVVADTSQFEREVARLGAGRASVKVSADTRSAKKDIENDITDATDKAAKKAEQILFSRIREPFEKLEQGEGQAYAANIVNRVRVPLEAIQKAEVQAYAERDRRNKASDDAIIAEFKRVTGELGKEQEKRAAAAESAAKRASAAADSESKRAIAAGERELAARRKQASQDFTPPKLINFGGEGIRPLNLLYASLAALSPLLISVGSSAVQAGAGIAALGAAGIGAGLALGGLVVAFQSISNALKLRKSTLAEAATAEQNSAQTAAANAAEELRQKNALLDTAAAQLKAEKDLSDARKQAAQDLVDLKQKVADLQNQEKDNTVSLAEAKANQAAVNANFFSTALDKARANQDVNNAKTTLGDTQNDRKKAVADLASGVKKGVEGSDAVVNARDQLRQARERRAEALADKNSTALASAATKVTSPMAQLQQQIKDMSPAARDMYNWFVANADELKKLQQRIEGYVLPGFTNALKIINKVGPDGKSSLGIAADAAGILGSKVGDLATDLAKVTQDKGFRKDFKTIVDNDSKAMDLLKDAVVKLVKPFTTIFADSSPLLVRFAGYIKTIAGKFADFIDKADKNGELATFFKKSGDELARWAGLAEQVSRFLLGLFTGSVQSGGTVIDRLTSFFKTAADWANSGAGQTAIKNFFDKLSKLPFGQIRDFAVQLGVLFSAAQIARFGLANPFFTTLALFAESHPDAAILLLKEFNKLVLYLAGHEKTMVTFLAVLTAVRALKGVGALKLSLSAIPGIEKLLPSLSKTATMTVQAGVVNVYGAAGATGALPAAGSAAPALIGETSKFGKIIATGLTVAGGVIGASLVVDTVLGKSGSFVDGIKALVGGPESYAQWSKENAPAFQRFFSMTLPNFITAGGTRGWSSFKDAFYNTFGNNVSHFLSITLPNSLNLGSGGSGGYAGLATNLGKFFSTTLPNSISGSSGGWPGVGKYILEQGKDFVGMQLPAGIQKGLDDAKAALFAKLKEWTASFWKFLKGLFGVASPSTLTAQIGGWLVDGLYNGFTQRWAAVWKTLQKFIATNITDPLTTTFSAIGDAIKDAFTSPFYTLTSALAAPVKAAFGWVNTYLITPLNVLLGKIGVSPIDLLNVSTGTTTGGVGNTAGGGISAGAGIIARADGGPVPGSSAHSRADNVPAMLTANEYVQPVNAVKHYGVGFMNSVRDRTFPKYADGGLVAGLKKAQGSNLATEIIGGALKGVTLKGIVNNLKNTFFGGDTGGATTAGDISVERIAEATARAMGATDKELVSLFEAGFVESGFRNLSGGDRDSLGFLQQRPSQGWGTPQEILNVAHATRAFITRIKGVDHSLTPGLMAQAVQRSAYPGRYDQRYADAVAALNRESPFLAGYNPLAPSAGAIPKGLGKTDNLSPQISAAVIAAHNQFPGVRVSSGYRPGANTVSGNRSYHSYNPSRAADFVPPTMGLFDFFLQRYGSTAKEIIYSPANNAQIKNGKPHLYGGEVREDHFNHVHLALAKGGLVPARKYDSGGTLPPGFTMAYNGTGKNETIRTAKQEANLGAPMRLDRRDIALLAAHIAQASNPTVNMDGRKVAAITNQYTYLPAGV